MIHDKITKSELIKYALSKEGQKLLSTKTNIVLDYNKSYSDIQRAIDFVKDVANNALGLAAPQIGINESWFVVKRGCNQSVIVVINPTIIGRIGCKQHIEGCFSELFPARVKRSKSITVSYITLDGRQVNETLDGLNAQIFQHEYSHLLGLLISTNGQIIKPE